MPSIGNSAERSDQRAQPPPIPEDADQGTDDDRSIGRGARAAGFEVLDREPAIIEVGACTEANELKGGVNEDSLLIDENVRLYAVLDGMGGEAAGEVASAKGAEFLREAGARMPEDARRDATTAAAYLRRAVARASLQIAEMAVVDPRLRGMGTTCSLLQLVEAPSGPPKQAITVQVGDSRFYRLRKGKLAPLTKEQSAVQMLIELGRLPPGADQIGDPAIDALLNADQRNTVLNMRNIISMAMGEPMLVEALKHLKLLEGVNLKQQSEMDVAVSQRLAEMRANSELAELVLASMEEFVDVQIHDVATDDVFIGTSDGAHDPLLDREMEAIARTHVEHPGQIAVEIPRAARKRTRASWTAQSAGRAMTGGLERGKDDDITVVAVRVAEVPEVEAVAVPDEEIAKWNEMQIGELRALAAEYRRIMEADERSEGADASDQAAIELVARRISRANGLRERYLAAQNTSGRLAIMALDRDYKAAALEEIDRILAARARAERSQG